MKRLFLSLTLLVSTISLGQNPALIFPELYIDFFAPVPLPIPQYLYGDVNQEILDCDPFLAYCGQTAKYTSNIQTDAQDNLLFFIVDGIAYDKEGNYIGAMQPNYTSTAVGSAETMIVPRPGSCSQYYIFTTTVNINNVKKIPYVFLLDMSVPNQNIAFEDQNYCDYKGAFIDYNPDDSYYLTNQALGQSLTEFIGEEVDPTGNLSDNKKTAYHFASSTLRSDNSRYIFVSNGAGFFTIHLTSSDVQVLAFNPYPSNVNFSQGYLRGEMEIAELANGNFRIAVPQQPEDFLYNNNMQVGEFIYTAEIDVSGSVISETEMQFPLYREGGSDQTVFCRTRGLEFNADGTKLYVTHTSTTQHPDALEYYDFTNGTTQYGTLTPVPGQTSILFDKSMIERSQLNELLIATADGLMKLNDIDEPSSGFGIIESFPIAINTEGDNPAGGSADTYMLQDQIDGEDYSSNFYINETCCIANAEFDKDIFSAPESALWEAGTNPLVAGNGNVAYVRQELRIPANKTVTIKNMEIRFAPGARLVVENGASNMKGGKLILDGTTLTVDDRCNPDALWLGVEVWGIQNEAQGNSLNTRQGTLIMKNDAIIENAWIGILVSSRNTSYSNDDECELDPIYSTFGFNDNKNGGIVQASNSKLLNNQRGVWFERTCQVIQLITSHVSKKWISYGMAH